MTSQAAILYDADCGFCRWSLAKLLAWDRRGRLRPVAIQSEEGRRLLTGMSEEERLASWHLVLFDRTLASAGAAAPHLFRLLPGGRPFAWLTAALPGATEWLYRMVADHRGVFGKLITDAARRRARRRIAERS